MLMALKLCPSVAGLPVAAQGSHAEEHSQGCRQSAHILLVQEGWKAWKRALKQSNALDDDGEQDAASLAAAKMVAAATRRFEGKGKGAADIPFSMLHKVWH